MKDNDKRELWERDKTRIQRARINFSLWLAKFQTKTHGMGIIILLFMAIFLAISIYNVFISAIEHEEKLKIIRDAECFTQKGCYKSI